jgi:D-arginine dehydrogenase
MNLNDVFDFVVVGAGIAGASVGYRLSEASSVMVLERESQPGYHSTGRSAAMFVETYGPAQVKALTRASRQFFEHPPEGFTEHSILTPRGALLVANLEQGELLRETFAEMVKNLPRTKLLSPEEAVERVPALRADRLAGAIVGGGDSRDMDVNALHQGFLIGMKTRGGALRVNAELESAQRIDGVWHLGLSDRSVVLARNLVNAAGAWADHVAALCGVPPIGLQPRRRTAFTFAGPQEHDFANWPAVVGLDERFYFKPDAGHLQTT